MCRVHARRRGRRGRRHRALFLVRSAMSAQGRDRVCSLVGRAAIAGHGVERSEMAGSMGGRCSAAAAVQTRTEAVKMAPKTRSQKV